MAYCVDLSGTLIWQTDIGGKNADWNILLDGNRLYMSAYGLYCLNREDGTIIWSVQTGCKTNCSFAADDTCILHPVTVICIALTVRQERSFGSLKRQREAVGVFWYEKMKSLFCLIRVR